MSPDETVGLLLGGQEGIARWNQLKSVGEVPLALAPFDIRNADLAGADLTDTDVTAPRLAGANLAGAKLPVSVSFDRAIKIIEESSKNCRAMFLLLLGACFYCLLVVAQTTDSDLLLGSKSEKLPLLQSTVSTVSFYYASPILLSCIFIYFHIYLQRLWELLADLPAILPDGTALERAIYPWLLNGFAHMYHARFDRAETLYGTLQYVLSAVLAWCLTPLSVWYIWGRALARHDATLTLSHCLVFIGVSALAADFLASAKSTLRREGRSHVTMVATISVTAVAVGVLSYQPVFWSAEPNRSTVYGIPGSEMAGYHPFPGHVRSSDVGSIRGKDLSGRHLWYGEFAHSDLSRVDFTGSVLVGADFTKAVFEQTRLTGARLTDAIGVTKEMLAGACGDGTISVTTRDGSADWYALLPCAREEERAIRKKRAEAAALKSKAALEPVSADRTATLQQAEELARAADAEEERQSARRAQSLLANASQEQYTSAIGIADQILGMAKIPEKYRAQAVALKKSWEGAIRAEAEDWKQIRKETSALVTPESDACTLVPIYFEYDSSALSDDARKRLEYNLACLQARGSPDVKVEGLTHPFGTEEYNLALGERVAQTAAQYLRSSAYAGKVSSTSFGEERSQGTSKTGWARDRRVEIKSR